jgi:hypothetical protein
MAINLLPSEKDISRIVQAVIQLVQGRSNSIVTPDVVLNPTGTTTTVNFENCSISCVPIPVPLNAAAATEIGNGTMFISSIQNSSFTVTHSAGVANRKLRFACLGG